MGIKRYDEQKDELNFTIGYNNEETAALRALATQNGEVDVDLLRRIALWKLDRVLDVPSDVLGRLRRLATNAQLQIDSADVRSLIEELLECPGIGVPMASTILKFLRPDLFPIIDVRAYRALYGKRLHWQQGAAQRKIDLYLRYAMDVRRISELTGRPLQDIDEQLYCFDLEHNGKI